MAFTKCCVSKNKNFNLVKINNNFLHQLNIIPLSPKYTKLFYDKKFYIHPNIVNSFYSNKYSLYLGKFRIIYFDNKNNNKFNTVTLPLNTRFFLLYYYVNNILNTQYHINEVNRIFSNITYIDDYNAFDYDNDIVMFPAIQ